MVKFSSLQRTTDAAPAGVPHKKKWPFLAISGLLLAAAGALAYWCWPSAQKPVSASASAEEDEDFAVPAVTNPGYVGAQACAACHAQRVADFKTTPHYRACRLPEAATMPSGFAPGHGSYATRNPGLRFEMTKSGDDFLQTAIHPTAHGEERTTARIALAYGTGNADEIYFTWHGDRLYELPMAWINPLKRWGEQPFSPYGSGDYTRTTTPRCLECHNTWVEHVAGTDNQYNPDTMVLGVTCERCHGPGREHVVFHQANPGVDSAQGIVHPGRLSRDRQIDLCGQCHSNAVKRRGPAFSYRPGEPLEDYFRTNLNDRPEEDHVANQVHYLRQSKCFQKSDTLTCITCHDPHSPKGPDTTLAVQKSCQKCHQPHDCAEQERLPAAVRGNCVGCHMPQFTRIQVYFHTENDQYVPPIRPHQHRIAVYPLARQEVLLGWHQSQSDPASREEASRLKEALGNHWQGEAERLSKDYRFLAAIGAIREAWRLDPKPATREKLREAIAIRAKLDGDLFTAQHQIDERRFADAVETLNNILKIKPDWARAHGKLGTAYAVLGQNDRAIEHLKAVVQYDPDDDYGYSMIGWLAFLQGKWEQAAEAYRQADDIQPYNAKINYHRGMALSHLGRLEEAIDCLRRALRIDPKHAGACHALSTALSQQGKLAEALRFARHAARLTDFKDPEILLTVAELNAEAGHFTEAETVATQALDLAPSGNGQPASQLRLRLEEIQVRARNAAK
ncbi:MAG: tetratricopeptide repeat protein [Gemmataceae bacterium]